MDVSILAITSLQWEHWFYIDVEFSHLFLRRRAVNELNISDWK